MFYHLFVQMSTYFLLAILILLIMLNLETIPLCVNETKLEYLFQLLEYHFQIYSIWLNFI